MYISNFFLENFSNTELYILALLALFFIIQIFFYIAIFGKISRYAKRESKGKIWVSAAKPNVSIIIYCKSYFTEFRDNIIRFLEQDYPNFEVVVVNDGSDNDLKDSVTLLKEKYTNLSYTYVPEEAHSLSRKKLALTVGIKCAKNEIVGITDAYCRPTSDKWLGEMMRNFIPDIDIVIGNSYESGDEKVKWEYRFYRLYFKLKYFSYAIMQKPYMGEGTNLFLKKSLFFENRGFSSNLAIKHGEDDMLTNELMKNGNSRVELSPESVIENMLPDVNNEIREMRLHRSFTSKLLKSSSRFVFGIEQASSLLFYLATTVCIVFGILDNYMLIPFAIAMFAIRYTGQSIIISRASKTLNANVRGIEALAYDFVRPIENIRFAILGKKSIDRNYTWRIRR